ncbi:fmi2 protein [Purpureocillium lavendulum]|uniref:Fmi2 protein n=1 Tax=Purpureocillium lavendulum TaxID=1247861 RepID=A0AB34G2C8_9HYPO|nr:fmi2 protein [Purpureocillium lavendulum]
MDPTVWRKPERSTPVSKDAVRSAPYTYHAPSPPMIEIPIMQPSIPGREPVLNLMPSFENVDPAQLSSDDLTLITRNTTQIATDRACTWTYEQRRQAQSILDFLYLGPTSVARDHAFLLREGITMIVVARDARMNHAKLRSVENASRDLGVGACYLDIDGPQGMIPSFPHAMRAINDHLLAVYHAQAKDRDGNGQMLVDGSRFRRGKVLVCCESGNDRSAAVVAAYIMAVFGKGMIQTLQFVGIQRFCCCFDEDTKRTLQSWEDILRARSNVAQNQRSSTGSADDTRLDYGQTGAAKAKRRVDDMMSMDDESGGAGETGAQLMDLERFIDRGPFVPFHDVS